MPALSIIAKGITGAVPFVPILPNGAASAMSNSAYNAVVGNGATFKAPITAFPTTTATWALFNGLAVGGDWYVIDAIYAFLASGTNSAGGELIACVTQPAQTAPSAFASTVISSRSGGPQASAAILANAYTITGAQPAWEVVGVSAAAAAATIGAEGIYGPVEGGLAVPPGASLGIDIISGTGTSALYGVGVKFRLVKA